MRAGDVVALCGPLGSGKTQLVKGIAAGLEVPDGEPVVSPTFVLVREYVGRLRLYHIDAYRLTSSSELASLGFEEMRADPQGAVAVEWADRVSESLPDSGWFITLAHASQRTRDVSIRVAEEPGRVALMEELMRICGSPARMKSAGQH